MKIGKRIMCPVYLDPHQRESLKHLSVETRVPMAAYMREGIDDLLKKYESVLKKREVK